MLTRSSTTRRSTCWREGTRRSTCLTGSYASLARTVACWTPTRSSCSTSAPRAKLGVVTSPTVFSSAALPSSVLACNMFSSCCSKEFCISFIRSHRFLYLLNRFVPFLMVICPPTITNSVITNWSHWNEWFGCVKIILLFRLVIGYNFIADSVFALPAKIFLGKSWMWL